MPTDSTESVFVGVDTHADTPHVAVVGNLGRHLDDREFPTDPGGYRRLLDWVRSAGSVAAVGVEGTGAYGAQLARVLTAASVVVIEVNRPDHSRRAKLTASPTLLTPMLQLKQWRPAEPTAPQNPETGLSNPSAAFGSLDGQRGRQRPSASTRFAEYSSPDPPSCVSR